MNVPDPHTALSLRDIALQAAPGFTVVGGYLRARYPTHHFSRGLEFINSFSVDAEKWDHHPDVDLRFHEVVVWLISHDDQAITHRDIRMSHLIAECANRLGVEPDQAPWAELPHQHG